MGECIINHLLQKTHKNYSENAIKRKTKSNNGKSLLNTVENTIKDVLCVCIEASLTGFEYFL